MRTHPGFCPALPQRQRGVVLLIALIVLVAMTLAGIGMMRSVDTGTVIAGNLAFKQSTLNAADAGISAAFNSFAAIAKSGNDTDTLILHFNHGSPCPAGVTPSFCVAGKINLPGYMSSPFFSCEVDRSCLDASNYNWWSDPANWNGAPEVVVNDAAGRPLARVNYLIHRMCQLPGLGADDAGQRCQEVQVTSSAAYGGTKTVGAATGINSNSSVYYRITARSVGPRNTVSYTQVMVLGPN